MTTTETKRKPSPSYTFSVVDGKPVHSLGAGAEKKLKAACEVLDELGIIGTAAKQLGARMSAFAANLGLGIVPHVDKDEPGDEGDAT